MLLLLLRGRRRLVRRLVGLPQLLGEHLDVGDGLRATGTSQYHSSHVQTLRTHLIELAERVQDLLDRLVPLRSRAAAEVDTAQRAHKAVSMLGVATRDLRDGDELLERRCPLVEVVELPGSEQVRTSCRESRGLSRETRDAP